jgi:hypothetical protein
MTLIEQPSAIAGADTPWVDASGDSGVGVLFDWLVLSLRALGDRELIRRAQGFEQRLAAERLTAAARAAGSSGDLVKDRKKARDALGGSGRSRRSRNRDARRAAAVSANPSLGEKVADGSIVPDSLDALARAADADTGHIPDELIDEVTGLSPDQTGYAVDRHLEDTADCEEVNDRYRAQMRARSCRRRVRPAEGGKPDLATLTLEGPDAVIDRAWAQIQADADAVYRNAGGRNRPVGEHAPWEHRLFDAAIAYFSGTTGDDTQPAGNSPSSSTPSAGSKRAGKSPSGSKPPIVVSIPLDDLGVKPATQHGTGPIGNELFQQYVAAGSPIYTLFTDLNDHPLWLGRSRRHASVAQYLALVVRDRGCVCCGASPQRCQAHHLIPWNAPAKGTTDIDQLALQCGPCHRELHRHNHTLYRTTGPTGRTVWATRPATPDETPPPRPATIQRE